MGKVEFFVVQFYGDKRTYYPGEVINGTVVLKVNEELKTRGIRLEFHGKASVHWSESTGSGEHRRTRHYSNSQVYIDTVATLFGKAPGQDGDNPILPPGDYSYPFQFLIPNQNMPTSVEARHGSVRYWLKGIIDRPWRFDITTKAVFTMLEFVDINVLHLLQPCQMQEDRNVGCLCCVSGPLSIIVQTDRGGYCPGEAIGVSASINNNTDCDILCLEIHLVQATVFIASGGKRKHTEDVVAQMKVMEEGVKSKNEARLNMVAFPVPSLPPTMTSCSCMVISYCLRLKVRVKGALNSNVNIPITIGSIPYRPPPSQYPPSFPAMAPTAPPLEGFSGMAGYPPPAQYGDGTQPYPNMAPPSYAECIYGGASIQDDGDGKDKMMGDTTFTPMYPFVNNYQFPSTSTAPQF